MQVMPKYHQDKLAAHGGEPALLEPEVNILVGTRILREYQRRLGDGNRAAAAATTALIARSVCVSLPHCAAPRRRCALSRTCQ